jgi:hypothetical protein
VLDPDEHDRLADLRHGELAPQGGRRGGERGDARGDVVADPGPVEPPGLFGDRAVRAKSIIWSTTDASSSSAAPGICRS